MRPHQHCKVINVTPPAAIVDNASLTTTEIDTLGYRYLSVWAIFGATDVDTVALKMQSGDVAGTVADVTGLVYGTSNDIAGTLSVIPTATDDNKVYAFEIDLKGRHRYWDLVATMGNGTLGTFCTVIAILWGPESSVNTVAERGFGSILRV